MQPNTFLSPIHANRRLHLLPADLCENIHVFMVLLKPSTFKGNATTYLSIMKETFRPFLGKPSIFVTI